MAQSMTKRAKWMVSEMILGLQYAIEHHEKFVIKKKNRKTSEFWNEVGSYVGHSGEEVESLLKNLQQSFQQQRLRLHLSGNESFVPTIRNSEELFRVFEEYYNLFYPRGGSALPSLIMTEQSVQFLSQRSEPEMSLSAAVTADSGEPSAIIDTSSSLSTSGPAAVISSSSSSSSCPDFSSSTSAASKIKSSVPLSLRKTKSVLKKKTKLSNESFLRQTLALETRKLQLKRQQLKIQERTAAALESISLQLNAMQSLFMVANGLTIEHEQCSEQ